MNPIPIKITLVGTQGTAYIDWNDATRTTHNHLSTRTLEEMAWKYRPQILSIENNRCLVM